MTNYDKFLILLMCLINFMIILRVILVHQFYLLEISRAQHHKVASPERQWIRES